MYKESSQVTLEDTMKHYRAVVGGSLRVFELKRYCLLTTIRDYVEPCYRLRRGRSQLDHYEGRQGAVRFRK